MLVMKLLAFCHLSVLEFCHRNCDHKPTITGLWVDLEVGV